MPNDRPRLHVESLEAREVPASLLETFDAAAHPALPSGWSRWSSDGSNSFKTDSDEGVQKSASLVTNGGSRTASLAWYDQPVGGDDSVAVTLRADSLVPAFVFTRGSGLGTNAPSYLAAVVTRGLKVEVWEVTGGNVRVLASVTSPNAAYLSGRWVRVTLVATGGEVAVQVERQDTGQYLGANGTWRGNAVNAIKTTTALTPATGFAGVGRARAYSGAVRMDNFEVIGAPSPGVQENYDTTAAGAAPPDWQSWTGGPTGPAGAFGASPTRALSGANGFASGGGSATAARAWTTADLPADADASAAIYLDSLIPARVFVRGSGLDTATPSYYAVSVIRGMTVQVIRVANGVETVLGSVNSADYISSQWVRVRIVAEGDRLRATVYRADTGQWMTPEGRWGDTPDFVIEARDSAVAGAGLAGVARVASFSGTITFDDFDAHPAGLNTGPTVTITPPPGTGPLTGEVTFRASGSGNPIRVEFRLNNVLRAASAVSPAEWVVDTTTLVNGTYTLTVRAFDSAGNIGTAEYQFTTNNADAEPIPTPTIPRHYSHIRIAQLAYSGNPMGTFEQNLLRNSVDLVIPNPRYLSTIQNVSPDTPQLIYSNVSNLYYGLLTDWLNWADRNGVSREQAFYHVTRATGFTGSSPSSQPVNWFWNVAQSVGGAAAVNVTSASRGGQNFNVQFGATGTTTMVGYTDKFRELNVNLVRGAASGWSGVWEYASATDAGGNPTQWKTINPIADGTDGLKQGGTITFDPPADWATATVGGGDRLFYVRFRVTAGTAAQGAELRTLSGRDYVGANGTTSGTIPAFDYAADGDGDGYLSDTEYANRRAGMNARFVYESRLFYPYYGQMRFATNPSTSAFRRWAADYHNRLLDANPLADGIFMDNATGKLPFPGIPVLEPTSTFSTDSGALLGAVSRGIGNRWVLANTAGGGADANAVAAGAAGAFEEFAIRPMESNWSEFGDISNLVAGRLASGTSYVVIDSHPSGGSPTDGRTQLGTLAYYYLLADPERTFLMFNGGYNPASTWTEHWTQAAAVDVGAPTGEKRVFATGTDPANAALTYQVLARDYGKALVLYKPLSYAIGVGEGTTANNTATTHQLGGSYRPVNADGSLGAAVTQITLRNGEGAVLVRA